MNSRCVSHLDAVEPGSRATADRGPRARIDRGAGGRRPVAVGRRRSRLAHRDERDPVVLDFVVDDRLTLFIGVLVVASALVFSVAPMMLALRLELGPALKAGSRTVAAHGRILSRVLVSTQSAVSVVLLISAALLLRSFGHLVTTDPGFDARQLLIAELDPSTAHPSQTERVRRQSAAGDALDRAARVPGIGPQVSRCIHRSAMMMAGGRRLSASTIAHRWSRERRRSSTRSGRTTSRRPAPADRGARVQRRRRERRRTRRDHQRITGRIGLRPAESTRAPHYHWPQRRSPQPHHRRRGRRRDLSAPAGSAAGDRLSAASPDDRGADWPSRVRGRARRAAVERGDRRPARSARRRQPDWKRESRAARRVGFATRWSPSGFWRCSPRVWRGARCCWRVPACSDC